MAALAVLLGGAGIVAVWAVWAGRRDAREEAARARAARSEPGVAPDPTNPFAAPLADQPESIASTLPFVFSALVVVLPSFVLTPLYGGALAAWNWSRVGDHRRAGTVLAYGLAVFALEVGIVAQPRMTDSLGTPGMIASLVAVVGSVVVLDRDQSDLHRQHPGLRTESWVYAVLFGVVLYQCVRALPTAVWIVTGSSASQPHG